MNTLDALNWRYATKKFDPSKKLNEEQLNLITESLRLSPSSYGLQPWKFVLVNNPEIRTKLREAAWNQPQITDASHLIILSVRTDIDEAFVDTYMRSIAKTRAVPVESLSGFADMIKGSLKGRTPEEIKNWGTHQVYLALGVALSTAAANGIDACPIEGFNSVQFDTILDLKSKKIESKVLLALGFRDESDESIHYTKSRFDTNEVVEDIR